MTLPPEIETLKHEAQLVSVGTWAEIRGWKLSKGTDRAGPCPLCGGTDRFAIHIGKQTFNCRRCGIAGEGVIKLVMLTEGLEFVPACELITGRSVAAPVDAGRAAELAQENARRERDRENEEERRRQQAIADGLRVWEKSTVPGPAHTGGVADYLALRGLPAMDWAKVPLREIMAHPYLVPGADGRGWQTIHTGPAMIAAVVLPDGIFGAVHQTWLDIHQVKGKLILPPDDKGRDRPAKKVRGSKKGGAIKLYTPMTRRRLIMGEGIETTGTAMTHNFERETAYWAGVDLGNMSGKAFYDLAGKRQEGLPDMIDEDCFLPPDWVEELVYLCDGDEVANKTVEKVQRGLLRAQALRDRARAERPELPMLDCWMVEPDAGGDLNDLVRVVA